MQAETRAARRTGRAFPESTRIVDHYRQPAGPEPEAGSTDSTTEP
jgi:hypothetical protein